MRSLLNYREELWDPEDGEVGISHFLQQEEIQGEGVGAEVKEGERAGTDSEGGLGVDTEGVGDDPRAGVLRGVEVEAGEEAEDDHGVHSLLAANVMSLDGAKISRKK